MTIGTKTQKTLWGRAVGRCSIPTFRKRLFEHDSNAPDPSLVGENCHIIAEANNGPRADPTVPTRERNAYPNLIHCCLHHHKVIDDQETMYTVEVLRKIKEEHEAWICNQLDFDRARQIDDELYPRHPGGRDDDQLAARFWGLSGMGLGLT